MCPWFKHLLVESVRALIYGLEQIEFMMEEL